MNARDTLRAIAFRFLRFGVPRPVITGESVDTTGPILAQWYAGVTALTGVERARARYGYYVLAHMVRAQFHACARAGFTITADATDPYPDSAAMFADVDAFRLRVFRSVDGDHPLLTGEENTMFRAVHDLFGHAMNRNSFGRIGEERAYWEHLRMFPAECRGALATETRGQNSYVNFGPDAHWNRTHPEATRYAPQRAALMPRALYLLRTGEDA